MTDGAPLTLSVHPSIRAIPAAAWDACAGGDNPFVSHAFLSILEDSGSACAETGWQPCPLTLTDAGGAVVACAPLYLKSHSYGEYVFDWSWADAFQRAGGAYYPKFQCAVPFTPATGPRLLTGTATGERRRILQQTLADGMIALAGANEASSVHITFPADGEVATLSGHNRLLHRTGIQFHWINEGYDSFDGFLAALNSRKRKTLRKEREKANAQGVRFLTLSGKDITPRHWQSFYGFYLATVDRKWSNAYLTERFFTLLGERMADSVVLVMGEDERTGELVCGALNLRGADTLYGRNWGATEQAKFLHFEACYYRAIEYAIAHGLKRVEAGAQGGHKLLRGYRPVLTHSLHWIAHPGLESAVSRALRQERAEITRTLAEMEADSPFRQEQTATAEESP